MKITFTVETDNHEEADKVMEALTRLERNKQRRKDVSYKDCRDAGSHGLHVWGDGQYICNGHAFDRT